MLRILALTHEHIVPSGVFGVAARERGHHVDEWSFRHGTPPPIPFDAYDALTVLGGSMHPDSDAVHPWLGMERALLRRALDRGTPVLGVCLGAQLLAGVAGGNVARAREPEIGWHPIALSDLGEADPVLGGARREMSVFQWHHYEFSLPPSAVALASNDAGLQAWRLGPSAWGVQFHAEVDAAIIDRWLTTFGRDPGIARAGVSLEEIRARTARDIEASIALGRGMAERFIGVAEELRSGARRARPATGS